MTKLEKAQISRTGLHFGITSFLLNNTNYQSSTSRTADSTSSRNVQQSTRSAPLASLFVDLRFEVSLDEDGVVGALRRLGGRQRRQRVHSPAGNLPTQVGDERHKTA